MHHGQIDGEFCRFQAYCVIFKYIAGKVDRRGGNFAWKTLPALLAKRGYVIHNYPEHTLMPGEKRTTLVQSKGIHDLLLRERDVLANALKDNSLTIQHITADDACRRLLCSRDPVIIGEAPGSELCYSHDRRQFFDSRIDRKGLLRLISPAPSPTPSHRHYRRLQRRRLVSPTPSSVPSHCPKHRMFVEVPLPPPSWRLTATQQPPPIALPAGQHHTSELIPEIVSLTQHSRMTSTSVD
ncbi:hypothetical protein BDR05DRAFT_896324 [Suillus weaverae]|nr:hypothetical protein BDR05DRAFT_896324 [Suillus weaverae]